MSFLGTLIGGGAGFLLGGPAGAAIGASIGGGVDAANAAGDAAQVQADAANRAADLQYKMWQEQVALQKPWLTAGEGALNRLSAGLAKGGEFGTPFSQTNWQQDPGYGFRMSEGLKALDRQAAARGGLISGAALKAAQRYGQDYGSQEYQNAFNRYYTERQNMLNPLQSMAGVGQTTAQNIGTAGTQMAQNVGDTQQSAAAARASGYVGQANALNSAISNAGNYYLQNQVLNRLTPTASAVGPWG